MESSLFNATMSSLSHKIFLISNWVPFRYFFGPGKSNVESSLFIEQVVITNIKLVLLSARRFTCIFKFVIYNNLMW